MIHLKRFNEEFQPQVDNIFTKFTYVHKTCGKDMIFNPNTNSCQNKLDFINDRIKDGDFKTNKPMDKYLMSEIVDILYRCSRIFKDVYAKSLHSRYKEESNQINELIDVIARETKYGQLNRAKPAIESWFKFITNKVSEVNKKMWIESTDGRKWSTDLGKFEVYLELLMDLPATEDIQVKLDKLSSNIFFYLNSTKIREYSEKDIMEIVDILKKNKTIKVNIWGWVNSPSGDLDQKRADAVKNIFISKGISVDRLTAEGKGISTLVPSDEEQKNAHGDSYNKNMRVEVKIIK